MAGAIHSATLRQTRSQEMGSGCAAKRKPLYVSASLRDQFPFFDAAEKYSVLNVQHFPDKLPSMAVVSITRVKLGRFWYLPAFLRHANASAQQLRGTPGFTGGYLASNWKWTFWTVSCWESREAMRAYRGSGAHASAMKHLPGWCEEAAVATIEEGVALPLPNEVARLMHQHGRLTRVDKPSKAHAANQCWPDGRVPRIVRHITPR